jgi:hypothetical protein
VDAIPELPWLDLHLPGRSPWQLVFVPPFSHGGDKCRGLTYPSKRKVYFDATLRLPLLRRTFAHEMFHIVCMIGRDGRLELYMEQKPEEDFAALFEKGGPRVLSAFGFQCPPLPEGFHAFRKKCVGQHVEIA